MLTMLIKKELKAILLSPKFAAAAAICAILMLLSVYVGIGEYRAAVKQFDISRKLADQSLEEQRSWKMARYRALRAPDPMQIFVAGVTHDIGRQSDITRDNAVALESSAYSDEPIYALFRHFDLAFVVQVVLSLFAILFTFDTISGEKESGTLKLVFSNSLSRARFLLAKGIGAWLGLIVPILLGFLLCLLLALLYGISFTAQNWLQILALGLVSLLYFTTMVVIGLLISTLTRSPNLSFLFSLVVWVFLVLIIPRLGTMAAGQLVRVPGVSQIKGQREAYARDAWNRFFDESAKRWSRGEEAERGQCPATQDSLSWSMLETEDSLQKEMQNDIAAYESRLFDDLRRRKEKQEELGFILSRISPAAVQLLASQKLAGSDLGLKNRYEDAMERYRQEFFAYADNQKEDPMTGAVQIAITADSDSKSEIKMNFGRDTPGLDISDVPAFPAPVMKAGEIIRDSLIDFGLLIVVSLALFFGAFAAFRRYDLR